METKYSFTLNGKKVSLSTDPLRRLLDVLREDFGCTGVKEGCSEGECGACSVMFNNRMVTPCLIPVGAANGQDIMTIEGEEEIRLGISGNICRCTGYDLIVESIKLAAERGR